MAVNAWRLAAAYEVMGIWLEPEDESKVGLWGETGDEEAESGEMGLCWCWLR